MDQINFQKIPDYVEPEHLLQDAIEIIQNLDKVIRVIVIVEGLKEERHITKKIINGGTLHSNILVLWNTLGEILQGVNNGNIPEKY